MKKKKSNVLEKIVERFVQRFNKSDKKTVELNNLYHFLGIDRDIDADTLSEATYFACLKVLSEAIGKLPLKLLRHNEKNGVITSREHPLYNLLHDRPNPYMTSSTFWSTVEYNRNHYGNAYVWIQGAGEKTKLWILPSSNVEVWYDDAKILAEQQDVYYIYSGAGKTYKFGSEEILHFKSSNTFDGLIGISVRERLKSTIHGATKAQKMLNRMYDSGFTAKAVLQYTGSLNDENAKAFVQGIENYAKGELSNDGIDNIIPIPLGSSLTPLNVELADNQFVEVKQYTALQIASAFGIKPYQIGDYTKSSYASAEAQQLSFYVDTLLYILKQYEEELTYKLLTTQEIRAGYYFKFNVAAILRADQQTQINTLSTAVNSFLYTPNEARALLDLESKDGGDNLLGNGSSIPVQYTGAQYTDIGIEKQEDVNTVDSNMTEEQAENAAEPIASSDELIKIIEAVKNEQITYEQAINVMVYSLLISEDTARQILGDETEFCSVDEANSDDKNLENTVQTEQDTDNIDNTESETEPAEEDVQDTADETLDDEITDENADESQENEELQNDKEENN